MAVVADVWSWSSSEASNSPSGSDTVGTTPDDILRKIQAAVRAAFEPLTSVSGTNTITASMANLAAYSSGLTVRFVPENTNTGATTININSFGAKNIYLNGATLVGYELRKNCPVQLYYDGTQFNIVAGAHGDGTPIATVKPFAGATVPNGFLLCYGQAVSRTTYADLFGAISTTYGTGDGSTTFNIPDLRGRVVAGQDDMGGTSANRLTGVTGSVDGDTLGGTGGEEAHTLTTDELAAHDHRMRGGDAAGGLVAYTNAGADTFGAVNNTGTSADLISSFGSGNDLMETTGGDDAHNNVQPTIILNYIIKV